MLCCRILTAADLHSRARATAVSTRRFAFSWIAAIYTITLSAL